MIYNIPLKQIEKIANPFKQISYSYLDLPLTIEELEKVIEKGNLEILPKDKERTKLLKKIAHNIINFTSQELSVDFDNMVNVESGWSVSNVEYLAAAIYLSESKKEDLIIKVNGKEELINTLFEPIENYNNESLFSGNKYRKSIFDWTYKLETKNNDFENPDWILKQDDIVTMLKQKEIPLKLWDNEDFVNKYFDKIEEIEDKYYDGHNDYEYFFTILLSSDAIKKDLVLNKTIKMLQKKDYCHFFSTIWEKLEEKKETEINIAIDTKEKIQQELKNNINGNILQILFKNQMIDIINKIHNDIPEDIKLSEENMDDFYKCFRSTQVWETIKLDPEKYIPKYYFEEKKNLVTFMSNIMENEITYKYNYVFDTWRDNKERIQELLKDDIVHIINKAPKSFEYLHTILPDNFKNSKKLAKDFLKLSSSNLIKSLPDKLREDVDLLEIVALKGYNLFHLSSAYPFYKMKDEKAQINLVKHNPKLVNEKHFPKEWLSNINILKIASEELNWKLLPEEIKLEIIKDKKLAIDIIKGNREIYIHLPLYLKIDKDIVTSYINYNHKLKGITGLTLDEEALKVLPPSVWYNKEILVNAVSISNKFMEKIPKSYFNDKEFIVNLLSIYEKIPKSIFNDKTSETALMIEIIPYLPEEIKIFLHENGIKKDIVENLSNIFLRDDMEYQIEKNNGSVSEVKKIKKKI